MKGASSYSLSVLLSQYPLQHHGSPTVQIRDLVRYSETPACASGLTWSPFWPLLKQKSRRAFYVYLIATLKESWVDDQDVLSSQVLWSALGDLCLFKLSGNLGHLQTLEHESNADKPLQFSERSHVCCKDGSHKESPGASSPVKLCFWRRQGCHHKSSVETKFSRKRCGWSAYAALAEGNAG